ncbi:hypothetical protein LguiA_023413 [Lonicera macranthoides]
MSLGYAEKLSYIEDVGNVGMPEIFDSPKYSKRFCLGLFLNLYFSLGLYRNNEVLEVQPALLFRFGGLFSSITIGRLAMMIQKSKHLVVFTGAGISTSCGIPDFRGPKGIWTLQREGKALPEASLPFHRALPSMTHMALVQLEKAGILKFVISQNIDGLHLRSGIPREKLAELHGNSFMEICPSCGVEYFRDFEVETIGLKDTSRRCSNADCGAKLKDTVLDWEITPACNLPLKCLRGGGKIAIVNLQKTPKDKKASLVIHALVDKVIGGVMDLLNLRILPFVRIDLLQTIFTQTLSLDKRYVNWILKVASVHGTKAPLPFIKSVEVSFSDGQNMKEAVLDKQPLRLKRRTAVSSKPFDILLKLNFSNGCGCSCSRIKIPVDFEVSMECFKNEKDSVFEELKEKAIEDPSCGQNAIIETTTTIAPKSEETVRAIVTNIIWYDKACHKSSSKAAPSHNGALKRRDEDGNEIEISWKRTKRRKHKIRL